MLAVLEAQGLTHAFGTRTVLAGVNLQLRMGEAVAIRGPSGSGKTTLVAILGGLLVPDVGRVVRHVDHMWVLQTTNALPSRTALDNVALGPLAEGLSRNESNRRARAAIGAEGLEARAHLVARRLSCGELQRVSVARALASNRGLVLADEPTGQLDAATAETVADALVGLVKHERALVIATHDPIVASRCHHVLDLVDGTLCSVDMESISPFASGSR